MPGLGVGSSSPKNEPRMSRWHTDENGNSLRSGCSSKPDADMECRKLTAELIHRFSPCILSLFRYRDAFRPQLIRRRQISGRDVRSLAMMLSSTVTLSHISSAHISVRRMIRLPLESFTKSHPLPKSVPTLASLSRSGDGNVESVRKRHPPAQLRG